VRHERLLSGVWGPLYGSEREYLRVVINQLRKKLEDDPAHPVYILTESHFGYRFNAQEQEGSTPDSTLGPSSAS